MLAPMRPLVPSDLPYHRQALDAEAVDTLVRACLTIAHSKFVPASQTREFVRQRRWSDAETRSVDMLLKAASSPAMTGTTGWAAEVTQVSYALLRVLAPVSAGAALLQRGLQLDFGRSAAIRLPTIASGVCSFVGEGQPIPVQPFTASGPQMQPRKMACICELSWELTQAGDAESLIRAVLTESVGKGLDNILFDATAGDSIRPAGLRYGVTGLTPAAAGAKEQAMSDDLVALGAAVGAVASGGITYIAALPQALAINIRSLGAFKDMVLPSAALPAGMVICIADAALAVAVEGPPQIDASRYAELHRETAPGQITSGGTMVTPVASIYQSDTIALRLRWPICWQLRASGAVAWATGVNW